MTIIPYILTEESVKAVPQSYIDRIGACSSGTVLDAVREYLADEDADKHVRSLVIKSFGHRLTLEETNNNKDLIAIAGEILDLDINTINYNASSEYLISIQNKINKLLDNDFVVDYIPPIGGIKIADIIEDLKDEYTLSGIKEVKDLYEALSRSKKLFKDTPRTGFTATPYTRVLYRRNFLKVVVEGIDVILERQEQGLNPRSWRFM